MSKSQHRVQVVETLTDDELTELAALGAVREVKRELDRRGGGE